MKTKIFSFIAVFLLISIIIFSCRKSNTQAINQEAFPAKGNLLSYYKTFDPQILRSGDELKIKAYLDKKALVIYDYIKSNYQDTICSLADGKAANIILGGLALAIYEQNKNGNTGLVRYQVSMTATQSRLMHCALMAVTGYDGIEKLLSGTASLMTGTEVLGLLKGILRRYVGYIGIAIAVYEFGGCVGWYN
jgi:hypothetical protein